jgi:uncharacterized protein (UPF0218 family)
LKRTIGILLPDQWWTIGIALRAKKEAKIEVKKEDLPDAVPTELLGQNQQKIIFPQDREGVVLLAAIQLTELKVKKMTRSQPIT